MRSDTTSGKWQKYLRYAGGVVFAVPDQLCTVADIPDSCGLIVRKEAVWRYARKPTIQRVEPPFDAWMKLLMDGTSRLYRPADPTPRQVNFWRDHEAIRQKFGKAVAEAARNLGAAEERLASLKSIEKVERERVDRGIEEYRAKMRQQVASEHDEWVKLRAEINDWLGIPSDTSLWAARRKLDQLKAETSADARVERADARVEQARRSLESALKGMPERPKNDAIED